MVEDVNPNGRVRLDAIALAMLRVRRFTKFRIARALHREQRPVSQISAWTVGGEPVPFAQAITQNFQPIELGTPWGRPWDTVWFDVTGAVPLEWNLNDSELVVDLGFTTEQPGFQAEGMVYRADGSIVKALEPLNSWRRSTVQT